MNIGSMERGFKPGSIMESLAVLFTSKRTLYREIDDAIKSSDEIMSMYRWAHDDKKAAQMSRDVQIEKARQLEAKNAEKDREIYTLRQRVAQLEASKPGRSDLLRN